MADNVSKLTTLILAVAEQHPQVAAALEDAFGARLLHALLISRSPDGDALVYRLCQQTPQLQAVFQHHLLLRQQ